MEALPYFDDSILDEYEEPMEVMDSAPLVTIKSVVLETSVASATTDIATITPNKELPSAVVHTNPAVTVLSNESIPVTNSDVNKDKDSTNQIRATKAKDNSESKKCENLSARTKAIPKDCTFCKGKHALRSCFKFWKLPHDQCLRHILMFSYCSRCLYRFHAAKDCRSKAKCRHCQGDHHSFLHFPKANDKKPFKAKVSKTVVKPSSLKAYNLPLRHMVTFSPTLQIKLGYGKRNIQVRAVLDLCCSHSYVSDQLALQLNIPSTKVDGESYCHLNIFSIYDKEDRLSFSAKISKITGVKTPLESVNPNIADHFKGFQLADPTFYNSGQVALVLGPELSSQILKGKIYSVPGYPLAQYTLFGWVISGLSPF